MHIKWIRIKNWLIWAMNHDPMTSLWVIITKKPQNFWKLKKKSTIKAKLNLYNIFIWCWGWNEELNKHRGDIRRATTRDKKISSQQNSANKLSKFKFYSNETFIYFLGQSGCNGNQMITVLTLRGTYDGFILNIINLINLSSLWTLS